MIKKFILFLFALFLVGCSENMEVEYTPPVTIGLEVIATYQDEKGEYLVAFQDIKTSQYYSSYLTEVEYDTWRYPKGTIIYTFYRGDITSIEGDLGLEILLGAEWRFSKSITEDEINK